MESTAVKEAVCEFVDRHAELLIGVARDLHAHPEENFEEHHAHALLTDVLDRFGLDVTRHAFGLETAFTAEAGSDGPLVAVFLEYDALPGLGHACGHNIIAAAGLGAGLATAELARDCGGRIRILGSPAEEGGGGKVFMIGAGALDDVEAAMMVHPADHDLAAMDTIAIQRLDVEYSGRSAHAASQPWEGVNALDAAVLGYMNVAALRQHIRPDERIHGVFTDGGEKPNIVPARSAMHWYVRAGSLGRLEELKARVSAALRAGALATGSDYREQWLEPAYAELRSNSVLEDLYRRNAGTLGRVVRDADDERFVMGSTDMGNVSQVVPSIHPTIAIAPEGIGIHTPAFASHAASPTGDRGVLDGAKAMAMTVVDLWTDEDARRRATLEFRTSVP